jgi:hypothetical protein
LRFRWIVASYLTNRLSLGVSKTLPQTFIFVFRRLPVSFGQHAQHVDKLRDMGLTQVANVADPCGFGKKLEHIAHLQKFRKVLKYMHMTETNPWMMPKYDGAVCSGSYVATAVLKRLS